MPVIKNLRFGGEAPKLNPHLLSPHRAQSAVDCNLHSGGIRSWRDRLDAYQIHQAEEPKTIYLFGENADIDQRYWCVFPDELDIVRGPIAEDSTEITFFTGGGLPQAFDSSMVLSGDSLTRPKSTVYLGIPAPSNTPSATPGSGATETQSLRSYSFTYVRKWSGGKDDEGPPSNPSASLLVSPGQQVTIANFGIIPSGHGITHVRVYRIATGSSDAEYQYVGELAVDVSIREPAVPGGEFVDTLLDTQLGEVLPSDGWLPPPDDLEGLAALPNGCLVGFSGKQVCFSEINQPHAWPLEYRYASKHDIVGLGVTGSTVVALTTAPSYSLMGNDPASMTMRQSHANQGCVSKRGIVNAPFGVLYPGHDGLVAVDSSGITHVYTSQLMTETEWADFYPETLRSCWHDGRYVGFYRSGTESNAVPSGGGFMLEPREDGLELTRLNFYAHSVFVDHLTDALFFARTDELGTYIAEFDRADTKRPYTWRSKRFLSERLINLGAARIDADYGVVPTLAEIAAYLEQLAAIEISNAALIAAGGIGGDMNGQELDGITINGDGLDRILDVYYGVLGLWFKLFADGVEVFSAYIDRPESFRLPSGYEARAFEFEVTGRTEIRSVALATSVADLMG